jgi:hypothetical protein
MDAVCGFGMMLCRGLIFMHVCKCIYMLLSMYGALPVDMRLSAGLMNALWACQVALLRRIVLACAVVQLSNVQVHVLLASDM